MKKVLVLSDIRYREGYKDQAKLEKLRVFSIKDFDEVIFLGDLFDRFALNKDGLIAAAKSFERDIISSFCSPMTNFIWILGDKDPDMEDAASLLSCRIVTTEYELELNDRAYWLTHGQEFDSVAEHYFRSMKIRKTFKNIMPKKFAPELHKNISAYKGTDKYTFMHGQMKQVMATKAKERGYDGIITGHPHHREVDIIAGIEIVCVDSFYKTSWMAYYIDKWEFAII